MCCYFTKILIQSFVLLTMAEDLALLTSSGSIIEGLVLRTVGHELSNECASPFRTCLDSNSVPNSTVCT